ncbi:MAG: hypothetical protein K8W52_44190 [Deltaproteobacteria bacterium]|nr:hypothetical protein [Deltaproteobacteria bacterium]
MRDAQGLRRGALIALLVIGTAGAAAASPPPCCDYDREPEVAHRGQYEIGPWISFLWLQGYNGVMFGGRFAAGIERGRWLFGGEAEVASVALTTLHGDALPNHIGGFAARAAATAKWTFARVGGRDVRIDFWLLGGVGTKTIRWWGGGQLVRPDVEGGIGLSEVVGRRRRWSLEAGVIVIGGRGVSRGAPVCAGPCDEPTPPVSADIELIDHIAIGMRW